MPSQAEIIHFCASPNEFMRSNVVEWQGAGPENQATIDVYMADDAVAGRYSGFWGKTNAKKFKLKWGNNPQNAAPQGVVTFQAIWSGYRGGQGRDANLPAPGGRA